MILGNDVSSHQGDINFDVYKNNTNFLIVKASEGTGFTDPKFKRNQSEARRVGIPLGYYHFARPELGNSSESEADWFLKAVGDPREGEMYCLDYEPNWNGNAVVWCLNFLKRMTEKLNGYLPLIYLNQSQTKGFNWKPVVDVGYGLWIAAYTYDPNKNDFDKGVWPFAAMQQWTNKQQVPGISGGIDGNVFFGDLSTFKKYCYKKPTTPADESGALQACMADRAKFWKLSDDLQAENTELKKSIAALNDYKSKYTQLLNYVKQIKDIVSKTEA